MDNAQDLDYNSEIRVRIFTPQWGVLLIESVNPHLPVKDIFTEARSFARSNYQFGDCFIVYKQMHVEQDATPYGLGMQDDDFVAIMPTPKLLSHPRGKVSFKEAFFYVGPVRNAKTALPIRKLVPGSRKSTLDELVESWVFYARKDGFQIKEKPTFVFHRDKKVALDIKILDIIDSRMKSHYFCIPTSYEANSKESSSQVDEESIDKLVEYIESVGQDANSAANGAKRKKKKQRKRQDFEERPESLQTDQVPSCPHLRFCFTSYESKMDSLLSSLLQCRWYIIPHHVRRSSRSWTPRSRS